MNSADDDITVHALPVVTLDITTTEFCIDDNAYTLDGGSPVGGEYTGTGVSAGLFTPATAGAGTHTITYTYTDGNGCVNSATDELTVHALPVVTLDITTTEFCVDDSDYTLDGNLPIGGAWSGNGVTGGTFSPAGAGAGTHTITYTYTDGNGCINSATDEMTVHALPVVTLDISTTEFCVDDSDFTLDGNLPIGGAWSGNGVTGGTFSPSGAGVGTHTITYTYTDGNGCVNSADDDITVHALPVVTLTFVTTEYCIDVNQFTLTGGSPTTPGTGVYSGTGVVGGTDFNPATAGAGTFVLTYTYTDENGCISSATDELTVHSLPVVDLTITTTEFCVDDSNYTLDGESPSGGAWSGNGVTGGTFSPAGAGVGTHTITYTYTDGNGCVNSATDEMTVHALPVVTLTFTTSDYCVDDASFLLTGGSPTGPGSGEYTGTGVAADIFTPATAGVGTHTITYTYTDLNGCVSSETADLVVHALPTVTISITPTEFCENDQNPYTVIVSPTSPGTGEITGNGVSDPFFIPSNAGVGTHTLTYTYTDEWGCVNSETTDVVVHALPVVTLDITTTEFCIDDAIYTLDGNLPIGGVWSGTGVTGGNFNPGSAGDGVHVITYTYTDGNNCINSATDDITVHALPVVTLDITTTEFCVDDSDYTLDGNNPVGGAWSGTGVTVGTFSPAGAGAGTHVITYTYTDGNGCVNSATDMMTVNALPVVTFNLALTEFCVDDFAYQMSGDVSPTSPGTGVISGNGVSGTEFDPSVAGVGTHVLTYTYTDANGCVNSATDEAVVYALPVVTLTLTQTEFCEDDAIYDLAGHSPIGGYYQNGSGVINSSQFDPSQANIGTNVVTYIYVDGNGCVNTATDEIIVHALPSVTLTLFQTEFCYDDSPSVLLGGGPTGGVYSGAGVGSGIFTPATAGAGTHMITYTYTDIYGCVNSATDEITVHALPTVTLSEASTAFCVDDNPYTLAGGSPIGGDYSGTGVVGGVFTPGSAGVGSHTVTYTYTDVNGCVNSDTQNLTVYALPNVSLTLTTTDYCVNEENTPLAGGSPTGPGTGVYSGTAVSGGNFNPSSAGVGTHVITYTYTDANGCVNSATDEVEVYPLPVVTLMLSSTEVCVDGSGFPLQGDGLPMGGIFSGDGVQGSPGTQSFNPALAGLGLHSITYSYTDGNGCIDFATDEVNVICCGPNVTLAEATTEFCEDALPYTLTGGSPVGGEYSGTSVSGGQFDPSIGSGVYTITYSYTDAYGCYGSDTEEVVVHGLPTVTFVENQNEFCVDEQAGYVLSGGSPIGGAYSGTGVSGGVFTPNNAGVGTHMITYSYTDLNGCVNTATDELTVYALPNVTMTEGTVDYCIDDIAVTLIGGSPAGGIYSGTGVNSLLDEFDPGVAGVGTHTITYTYTDINGCVNSDTQNFTVHSLPVVSLALTQTDFCSADNGYVMSGGSPIGGDYTGLGVVGGVFNASAAGIGTHVMTYTYTDGNGCVSSATDEVTVHPAPTVTFAEATTEFCYDAADYALTGGTPSGGAYSGNGVTASSFDPSAAGVGTHTITYTYTDNYGCVNTATEQMMVYGLPTATITPPIEASFCENQTVTLTAGTDIGDAYQWKIDGVDIPLATNSTYDAGVEGEYTVVITNSNTGCTNTSAITFAYESGGTPTQPGQPTITAVGVVQFTMNWSAVDGVEAYEIQVATDAAFANIVSGYDALDVGDVLTYDITGLTQNTTYWVRVRAYNGCGTSAYSVASSQRTYNPTIVVSTNGPIAFGEQIENTCSSGLSFNVSATELVANLTLTPPVGFELSTDNVNWNYDNSTPLVLIPNASGNIGNQAIYVRFCPTSRTGYDANVTVVTSYDSENVNVTGTGIAAPPTTQASCIVLSGAASATSFNIDFTNGNGEDRLIVINETGGIVTWQPTDGTIPTNGSMVDANHRVYVASSLTLPYTYTGATANTVHEVKVYEYNGDGRYLISGFNSALCCLSGTGNPAQQLYLDITVNDDDNVSANTAFDVDVTLLDRVGNPKLATGNITGSYSTTATGFSGTSFTIATGTSTVATSETISNAGQLAETITATPACSTYIVAATSASFNVLEAPPTSQARYLIYSTPQNCGGGTVDIPFRFRRATIPGTGVIVVARLGAKPEAPQGGTNYSASLDWNSAGTYGTGNQNHVLYIGNYTSNTIITATNIPTPSGVTLWTQVYEYNGAAWETRAFNTNAGSVNPKSASLPACRESNEYTNVELAMFDAKSAQKQVFTAWETYLEEGILGYELYRANVEGFESEDDFTLVGDYLTNPEMAASLNIEGAKYEFVDDDPSLIVGNEYIYKLVYVGIDGEKILVGEDIVTVLGTTSTNALLSIGNIKPQPATDKVSFDLSLKSDQAITVEVLDMAGRKVMVPINGESYSAGTTAISFPLDAKLASGTYILSINAGSESVVTKFIVKK